MAGDEGAFVVCMNVLRWSGLSFTKVRRTPRGDYVARNSSPHLLVNSAVACVCLFAFFRVDPNAYARAGEQYESWAVVYPLYTKLMMLTVVAFALSGNFYNRKFVDLMNLFGRVARELGPLSEGLPNRRNGNGRKVLFAFLTCAGASTGLGLWMDSRLAIRYDGTFRIVHYFCFYYVTLFTAHFVITMNHVRENFRRVNAAFARIVRFERSQPNIPAAVTEAPPRVGSKIRGCMSVFVDLRAVEESANEVFGKQTFLTLFLAFSSVCVNAYYFIALNLHGTSYLWLNLTMCLGFLQSVIVAFLSTRAATLAVDEANRVKEIVLGFPLHLDNWRTYNRIKYFSLFAHYCPMKFRAWIFYALDYDSLLKVILTSSAVTALILQCDFLRGKFEVRQDGTTALPSATDSEWALWKANNVSRVQHNLTIQAQEHLFH